VSRLSKVPRRWAAPSRRSYRQDSLLKYGRPLALRFAVLPELLGGIRVKVGSDVWDGSVKARLEALQTALA